MIEVCPATLFRTYEHHHDYVEYGVKEHEYHAVFNVLFIKAFRCVQKYHAQYRKDRREEMEYESVPCEHKKICPYRWYAVWGEYKDINWRKEKHAGKEGYRHRYGCVELGKIYAPGKKVRSFPYVFHVIRNADKRGYGRKIVRKISEVLEASDPAYLHVRVACAHEKLGHSVRRDHYDRNVHYQR